MANARERIYAAQFLFDDYNGSHGLINAGGEFTTRRLADWQEWFRETPDLVSLLTHKDVQPLPGLSVESTIARAAYQWADEVLRADPAELSDFRRWADFIVGMRSDRRRELLDAAGISDATDQASRESQETAIRLIEVAKQLGIVGIVPRPVGAITRNELRNVADRLIIAVNGDLDSRISGTIMYLNQIHGMIIEQRCYGNRSDIDDPKVFEFLKGNSYAALKAAEPAVTRKMDEFCERTTVKALSDAPSEYKSALTPILNDAREWARRGYQMIVRPHCGAVDHERDIISDPLDPAAKRDWQAEGMGIWRRVLLVEQSMHIAPVGPPVADTAGIEIPTKSADSAPTYLSPGQCMINLPSNLTNKQKYRRLKKIRERCKGWIHIERISGADCILAQDWERVRGLLRTRSVDALPEEDPTPDQIKEIEQRKAQVVAEKFGNRHHGK